MFGEAMVSCRNLVFFFADIWCFQLIYVLTADKRVNLTENVSLGHNLNSFFLEYK